MSTNGTLEYGLGQVTPSSIEVLPPSPGSDEWNVFTSYTSGNNGRNYDIEFRYCNAPASITYAGENPSKDYVS